MNYLLDGEVVVFRSGAGSKLLAMRGAPVSFQLDEFDELRHTGWSVLVRGAPTRRPRGRWTISI